MTKFYLLKSSICVFDVADNVDLNLESSLSDRSHMLSEMFRANSGVLAYGGCGTVLLSKWMGKEVAIKFWNRLSDAGSKELRKEVHVYKILQKTHSCLLGLTLPELILAWDEPNSDSPYRDEVILVTRYVGERIVRGQDGHLWICRDGLAQTCIYEKLDDADEKIVVVEIDLAYKKCSSLETSRCVANIVKARMKGKYFPISDGQ